MGTVDPTLGHEEGLDVMLQEPFWVIKLWFEESYCHLETSGQPSYNAFH